MSSGNKNKILLCSGNSDDKVWHLKNVFESYGFEVEQIAGRREAMDYLKHKAIDVIVSELNLGETDAVIMCQEIRSNKEIIQPYIIICSDREEDYVQITSLNSGADDFVVQPIKPLLLSMKIKSMLKRRQRIEESRKRQESDFIIDKESYCVYKNGEGYFFPRKEFEMLDLLFSQPGKVFTRLEIALSLWHNEKVAKQRTIDIHVRNIRKKIGHEVIKTIKGAGYFMEV